MVTRASTNQSRTPLELPLILWGEEQSLGCTKGAIPEPEAKGGLEFQGQSGLPVNSVSKPKQTKLTMKISPIYEATTVCQESG